MTENIKESFQALDFVLFFGVVVLSLGVGTFFAFRDRKKKSTDNYYFGERQISPVAVAVSISVSYISAVTVLGVPADVYLHGNAFGWHPLVVLIVDFIAIVYHIPLFHRLKVLSVFEYLEMRFHRYVRMIVSGLEILSTTLYMAVATFLPALALYTVTPLDLRWTIALTSITCTIYTSLGGMKAVIWADVIQALVMIAGMLAMFILALSYLGGFSAVEDAVQRGGRMTLYRTDPDPRTKYTVWSMIFGISINAYHALICSQAYVQRWLSCKTVRKARIAVASSFIPLALMNIFAMLIGLTVYAYYEGCDPLLLNKVSNGDQIVPYMVVNIFRNIPGMAGLFVSAAFCGTLSSVSSGINALSAMAFSDFIGVCWPNISQNRSIWISKALTFFFGTFVMILAYLISLMSSNILGIGLTISGLFAGPVVAIFIMGVFMPWITYKSVLVGSCTGFLFILWIAISAMVVPVDESGWQPLPRSVSNCTFPGDKNSTYVNNSTIATLLTTQSPREGAEIGFLGQTLFAISPYFYGLVGTISCIFATYISSIFTGFEKPSPRAKRLSVPIIGWSKAYPSCLRRYFDFDGMLERNNDGSVKEKTPLTDKMSSA